MGLVPFDDVSRRLHLTGRSYAPSLLNYAVQEIRLDRIGPEVDVGQLVHTEQQRLLLDETGLGRARPETVISSPCSGATPNCARS